MSGRWLLSRGAAPQWLAASACLGLAAANIERAGVLLLVAAVASGACALAAPSPGVRFVCVALLVLFAGWWWGVARLDAIDRSPLSAQLDRAGPAVVVITAPPVAEKFGIRAQGTVRTFKGVSVGEPVQLELPLGRAPPQGAIIEAFAVVARPKTSAEGFDEQTWLRRHGIHVVLRVDQWRVVGRRGGLGGVADRLRRRLQGSIAPGLTGERRAVLEGIVLGDESALSPGLKQDFQASGLFHLLAVSGENVVLIAGGVLAAWWLLGFSRVTGELAVLAAIAGYVLAVGPQPSVIRAGIAGGLASLAWLTGRLRDAWHAFWVAAAALLAWNPYELFDPGFQLSFAAVAAIFLLVPWIKQKVEPLGLPRRVTLGIAVSGGCGIVTAPIVWFQFGYLPLLSIPANILVEPAMPALLGLAFVTAALDPISPAAASIVAWFDGWVAWYIAFCARFFASLPGAEVTSGAGLAAAAGTVTVGAYACWRWRTKWS